MKILVISTDYPPRIGGIAVFIHNLCCQLEKKEHKVDVLTCASNDSEKHDEEQPFNIYRYPTYKVFSSFIAITYTLWLYAINRYDIILSGYFASTHVLGMLILRKLLGIPYIILSHGNDLHYTKRTKVDWLTMKLLAKNAALIMGNSRFTIKYISEIFDNNKLEILNPGVDINLFNPYIDANRMRMKYGLLKHEVLLTTARLVKKKNISGVLKALPKVIERIPELLYVIAGEGEHKDELKILSEKLGISKHVKFIGHVKNDILPALYCAADLYIMPSYKVESDNDIETFGISFIEASACGKPVIGGRSGGIEDAVIDGKTGLLVNSHDLDEIANAIIRILKDKDFAGLLGRNGRKLVENKLNWEKSGQLLENYMNKVLGKSC